MQNIEIKVMESAHINEITRMHISYLSTEFKGIPGKRLLQQYYQGVLSKNGAIGYVGLIDGKVSGFVCGVWDFYSLNHWIVTHSLFQLIIWNGLQIISSPKYLSDLLARLFKRNSRFDVQGYELRPIVVETQDRGTGLAGLLVDRLVEDAKKRGYSKLHLFVENDNLIAQKFYKKKGFVRQPIPELFDRCLYEMEW
jgi:ribosomal protein S18 acetylase RimI-like enzyme